MSIFNTPFSLIHTVAACASLGLGPLVFFNVKGRRPVHRWLGTSYAAMMLTAIFTSFAIYTFSGHFSAFHFFALLTLSYISWGLWMLYRWRTSHDPRDLRSHFRAMALSYHGLILATIAEGMRIFPWHSKQQYGLSMVVVMGVGIAIGRWFIYRHYEPKVGPRYFPRLLGQSTGAGA